MNKSMRFILVTVLLILLAGCGLTAPRSSDGFASANGSSARSAVCIRDLISSLRSCPNRTGLSIAFSVRKLSA